MTTAYQPFELPVTVSVVPLLYSPRMEWSVLGPLRRRTYIALTVPPEEAGAEGVSTAAGSEGEEETLR